MKGDIVSILGSNDDLDLIPAALARAGSDLEAAVDRFDLQIAREAARTTRSKSTVGLPSVLPAAPVLRPVRHRVALPRRPHGAAPRSLVDLRDGKSPLALAVGQRAERVAEALRKRLLALRRNLAALQQRAERRSR